MKVSRRDILLLVGFIGILAAICSYFFVFQPYQEKTELLRAENEKMNKQIQELTNMTYNREVYIRETKRMNQEIESIYQLFPVNVKEEDCILLAINQELIAPMEVQSMNIEQIVNVEYAANIEPVEEHSYTYDLGEGDVFGDGSNADATANAENGTDLDAAAAAAAGTPQPTTILRNRQTTINYVVSYDGLKRSVQNIANQTDRIAIDNMTVAFDDTTGLLVGTTAVNMYSIPFQEGKEYMQPDFSSVLLGTDNIFGTIIVYHGDMPDTAAGGEDADAGAEEAGE